MMLKCTSINVLGNNFVEIRVKDVDDNPKILPGQMEEVDVVNADAQITKFTNMRLEGKSADMQEGGFLVHPYIYRYDTME